MFDARLRAEKDKWLHSAALAMSFMTPNQVTILSFVFGCICGYYATQRNWTYALVFWGLNRLFDGLDGSVARVSGQQSDFGGYFDIVMDFIVYSIVPICIAYGEPSDTRWLVVSFLLGTYFVNAASWMYLSAVLEKQSAGAKSRGELTTVTMPPGLIGGFETVIFFSCFLIFPQYATHLFFLMGFMVCLTIVQRLIWARWNLDKKK